MAAFVASGPEELRDAVRLWTLNNSLYGADPNLWDVSRLTSMTEVFINEAASFNHDINSWDVSSVTDFERCFSQSSFNQNINGVHAPRPHA